DRRPPWLGRRGHERNRQRRQGGYERDRQRRQGGYERDRQRRRGGRGRPGSPGVRHPHLRSRGTVLRGRVVGRGDRGGGERRRQARPRGRERELQQRPQRQRQHGERA